MTRNTKIGAGAKGNEQLQHEPWDLQEITSLLGVCQKFLVNYVAGSFIEAGIFHWRSNRFVWNHLVFDSAEFENIYVLYFVVNIAVGKEAEGV